MATDGQNEEQLRDYAQDLREAVARGELDIDTLLQVGTDLARRDEARVRFLVDASHISRLGLELVAKQETAVAELVKNGYDADAESVKLTFTNASSPGGTLEIRDDGNGMAIEELIDGFMRLSTANKVANPTSPRYGRGRAGRKGIGRFAAQRLGRSLAVTTEAAGATEALRVVIDWDRFEANRDLYTIDSVVERLPARGKPGTTILIRDLRDGWSDAQVRRAYRYIADLLQPFPLARGEASPRDGDASAAKDPGFKAEVVRIDNGKPRLIADEQSSILDQAIGVISGRVDDTGRATWSLSAPRLELDEVDNPFEPERAARGRPLAEPRFPQAAGARFEARYFIRDPELLPAADNSLVQKILSASGGIRLYRNGFRVPPYGEPYDDWLRLDAASRARTVLAPIGNTNFLGFVEIRDVSGERFEETSGREGLVENEAFEQLRTFVFKGLRAGVLRIASARGRKGKTRQPAKDPQPQVVAAEAIKILDSIETQAEERASDALALETEQLRAKITELGEIGEALVEERAMLRVLAGLGLTIGEFTHEVRSSLGAASSSLSQLADELQNPAASATLLAARTQLDVVRSYAQYFDAAVISNSQRALEVMELRDLVNAFEKTVTPTLKREGYTLQKVFNGYNLFTKPMHRSEWSSILLNLFTNAIKAIRNTGRPGEILISARSEGRELVLDFCDTGTGIAPGHRDRVFDAFFTTTSSATPLSSEADELTGSGLGLKIVKDIIGARDGTIHVIDPPPGYSTCFEIRLPRAELNEVPEHVR